MARRRGGDHFFLSPLHQASIAFKSIAIWSFFSSRQDYGNPPKTVPFKHFRILLPITHGLLTAWNAPITPMSVLSKYGNCKAFKSLFISCG
jgi:hypothetical protein